MRESWLLTWIISLIDCLCSPIVDSDSDDEMYMKPARKKKIAQADLNDFFDKVPVLPAKKAPTARKVSSSKPAPSKKVPPKKNIISDDDDDDDSMGSDASAPAVERPVAPKRVARAAPKRYIEVLSEDEEGPPTTEADDSLFMDDD